MSALPGSLVEAVFKRALGPDLTAPLVRELAELGLDVSIPLSAAVPRDVWHRAVACAARDLYPSFSAPEQLRQLGRHLASALQRRGLVRGPWLSMARLLGPRRALRQAREHLDRSPVRVSIHEHARTDFEIGVEAAEQPEFLAGVLEGALLAVGARDAHVSLLGPRGGMLVFRATWH